MESLFKAGDIVRLKISNQPMKVKGLAFKPSSRGAILIEDRFECEWNLRGKKQKAVFHKDALELLENDFVVKSSIE
jgi:uncharacterized protein YodC (DUF2158 family)